MRTHSSDHENTHIESRWTIRHGYLKFRPDARDMLQKHASNTSFEKAQLAKYMVVEGQGLLKTEFNKLKDKAARTARVKLLAEMLTVMEAEWG